jgi:hypothetical protein
VGEALGLIVGLVVGAFVGEVLGLIVGLVVGDVVGETLGLTVGLVVGDTVGETLGLIVGLVVGDVVGDIVGLEVGAEEGCGQFTRHVSGQRPPKVERILFVAWQHTCGAVLLRQVSLVARP